MQLDITNAKTNATPIGQNIDFRIFQYPFTVPDHDASLFYTHVNIVQKKKANMDIPLILDADKVPEYMTKNMIHRLMMNSMGNGQNVQATLQYAMSKLEKG
eukprot:13277062-Ditylum_brightwellii.AAC.1